MKRLPECKRTIEEVDNPMALWTELLGKCEEAYTTSKEDMIRRFYEFAWWCWKSQSDDVRTAVACAFYEHLPRNPKMRRDLPRRFGRETFEELREVFCYLLSLQEAAEFDREYLEAEREFVRRTWRRAD